MRFSYFAHLPQDTNVIISLQYVVISCLFGRIRPVQFSDSLVWVWLQEIASLLYNQLMFCSLSKMALNYQKNCQIMMVIKNTSATGLTDKCTFLFGASGLLIGCLTKMLLHLNKCNPLHPQLQLTLLPFNTCWHRSLHILQSFTWYTGKAGL